MAHLNNPTEIIRPELLALHAYHVPAATGMIKLDAMENPYALPQSLQNEIAQLAATAPINRYPDPNAADLKASLREALDIPDSMAVLLGNGSDEIIQLIAMAAAKPDAVLLSVEPAFVMFRMIATFADMKYVGVPLKTNLSLDIDAMLKAIEQHRPAVIFLAYPNNPTGNLFDEDALLQIIEATPGIVVIDEAYQAFAGVSMMNRLEQYPNLLLMRTLSKSGLAGLRLGLLIGRSMWLDEFEKLRLPYNVGVMTQLIAQAVLRHTDVLSVQAERIKIERTNMLAQLAAMDKLAVYPSDANFILFRVKNATEIFQTLKQKGILIKNLDGAHTLLDNCLRVTVGTPEENAQFLATLHTILREKV
ncbi:histidinol-phosphate transaminase [Nitrosomonas aestuarii]|uniref:histidinol-phosphate transaminase n=1 Tax=Nitrosomonas aestuarii TaxID=52441 RepID=UPI000D30BCFF|nr:histidinol-phosphate transaminase [Nitrosomonas aestuarii]PTN12609.1 histidinol phosphate aminotransferase [Nitrosomonas aestuarii]